MIFASRNLSVWQSINACWRVFCIFNINFIPNNNFKDYSSNGLLNFYIDYYNVDDNYYIILFITGVHKKCNYSSYEIDYYVPSATNKVVSDNLKSKSRGADEFYKLLESNTGLKKSFLKLKTK